MQKTYTPPCTIQYAPFVVRIDYYERIPVLHVKLCPCVLHGVGEVWCGQNGAMQKFRRFRTAALGSLAGVCDISRIFGS